MYGPLGGRVGDIPVGGGLGCGLGGGHCRDFSGLALSLHNLAAIVGGDLGSDLCVDVPGPLAAGVFAVGGGGQGGPEDLGNVVGAGGRVGHLADAGHLILVLCVLIQLTGVVGGDPGGGRCVDDSGLVVVEVDKVVSAGGSAGRLAIVEHQGKVAGGRAGRLVVLAAALLVGEATVRD